MRQKLRPVAFFLLVGMLLAMASVSCVLGSDGTATPSASAAPSGPGTGRFASMFVRLEGELYRPDWGALREDLVDTGELSPIDGEVIENVSPYGVIAPDVFEISGIDGREFIVGRVSAEDRRITTTNWAPSCIYGGRVFIFTAVDTEILPPPFSYPTRTPSTDGEPTPTPAPTSTAYASEPLMLTGDRLLEAGWPRINWEQKLISYGERWYAHTIDRYLDGSSPATAIRSDQLDEVELVEFEYEPSPELPEQCAHIFEPAEVTDYLRVYRPTGVTENDVIVIDPCPDESDQAEYVVYRKMDTED